jgi:hypothetical protein
MFNIYTKVTSLLIGAILLVKACTRSEITSENVGFGLLVDIAKLVKREVAGGDLSRASLS